MDQLSAAVDALSVERLDGLFGPALLERLGPLLALQNRLAAEVARTVRQCELAGAAEHDGKASMASWLRGHARMSQSAAGQLVRNGRALEQLPAVAEAAAAGAISTEAVAVLAPVAAPKHLAAAEAQGVDLAGVDAALAQVAATRPYAQLRQVVGHYLARLDPDGPEPDPTDQRSLLFVTHADGSVSLRGELDAVGGERVQAAVESIVQASRPAGDTRTRAQRCADALVQLADNALAAGSLPTMRTVKPHVAVTVPLDELVGSDTGQGAAELGFGAVISAARARWLACDGNVTRVVVGPEGQPLELGRSHRVVPAHLRRAVELRDRRCVFSGCDAPSHWCDVHSATPRGPRRACESRGGGGPSTQQGARRLHHRTGRRRAMAHLPARRHRDPRSSPHHRRSRAVASGLTTRRVAPIPADTPDAGMPHGSLPLATIMPVPTLSRTPAFWTAAGLLLLCLAASGVPTPLYRVYQEQFGFGPGTLTAVFGIYAFALLAALLVVGGLSDHIGRRPVLLGGLLLQAAAMVIFLVADGVGWLLAARVVQGLSMGALTGTLGAVLLDTQAADRPRGALLNSAAPGLGLSLGAVGAAVVVEYVASPTRWVFAALTGTFLLGAALVALLPETSPRAPGALASLRPTVKVPRSQRPAFLAVVPVLVAAWSLGGLYLSLGPSLVASVFGIGDHLVGSLFVLAMQGSAAVGAVLGRDSAPERAMVTGASVFAAGVAGTIAAVSTGQVVVLFASAVVSGLGFGLAFLGAVAMASAGVAADERAGLLSSVFVVGYLSFSVPAIIAGIVSASVGLETVTEVYAGVLIVLALTAVAGVVLRRRRAARPTQQVAHDEAEALAA